MWPEDKEGACVPTVRLNGYHGIRQRAGDRSAGKDLMSDRGLDNSFRSNGWFWKGCKGTELHRDCR